MNKVVELVRSEKMLTSQVIDLVGKLELLQMTEWQTYKTLNELKSQYLKWKEDIESELITGTKIKPIKELSL